MARSPEIYEIKWSHTGDPQDTTVKDAKKMVHYTGAKLAKKKGYDYAVITKDASFSGVRQSGSVGASTGTGTVVDSDTSVSYGTYMSVPMNKQYIGYKMTIELEKGDAPKDRQDVILPDFALENYRNAVRQHGGDPRPLIRKGKREQTRPVIPQQ